MNRTWLRLVVLGVVLVIVVVGWDLVTLWTGIKKEFRYSLLPMDPGIYGATEAHLRGDRYFSEYEAEAALEN